MTDKMVQREAGVLRELDSALKGSAGILGKYLKIGVPDLVARAVTIETLNAEQEAAKTKSREATKSLKELFGPAWTQVAGSIDIIKGALKIAGAADMVKQVPRQPSSKTFEVRVGFMGSFSEFVKKLRERFPKLPNVDVASLGSKLDGVVAANTARKQADAATEAATKKLNEARAETMSLAGAWRDIARGIFELEKAEAQLDVLRSIRMTPPQNRKPAKPPAEGQK